MYIVLHVQVRSVPTNEVVYNTYTYVCTDRGTYTRVHVLYVYFDTYIHVHVNFEVVSCCLFIVWGHLDVWGELASRKRLFNPLSQFSRLGILVSSSVLLIKH